jgi:hypothetical protein
MHVNTIIVFLSCLRFTKCVSSDTDTSDFFTLTCARSASIRIQKCQPSPLTRCGLSYRSSRRPAWCRRCSRRRTRLCTSARKPGTWDWPPPTHESQKRCRYNSGCLCCKIAKKVNTSYTDLVNIVYLVLKLLPVPVPAQRRHALAGLRVPDLESVVPTCTG